MSRIRTIKPEYWEDELVGALSVLSRLLYIALWSFADDQGRFRANPVALKASAFAFDETTTREAVAKALDELATARRVFLWVHNGQQYGIVRHWKRHQKVDKPGGAKYPDPPLGWEDSLSPREESTNVREPSAGASRAPSAQSRVVVVGSDPIRSDPIRPELVPAAPMSSAEPPTGSAGEWEKETTRSKPSVAALEVAQYLADAIHSHTPTAKTKPLGWAREIDLAIRQDGRTPEQLRRVIDQAHRSSDPFWRPNLLSGQKLREKFDALWIKANAKPTATGRASLDAGRASLDPNRPYVPGG